MPQYLDGHGALLKSFCNSYMVNYIANVVGNPRLLVYPKSFSREQRILAESFRKNGVTHVLAEFGNCAVEVMNVCAFLNIKLISHFHGYEISKFEMIRAYLDRYKELFAISYRVVAVSKLMQNNLLNLGCPAEKILYCPCGPNDKLLDVKPTFDNDNILYIGRFVDKKAPYDLILAFVKVLEKIPSATLTMIGVGELLDCCKQLVSYYGISDSVHFEGVVDHDSVSSYFEKASLYCQPSARASSGDQEGTPVSVMEASLSSLPVLATHHAGIPDVIINGETGCLVNEHDVLGMSEAIIKLLCDKEAAKSMGTNGRNYVKDNFMLSVSLGRLRQIVG